MKIILFIILITAGFIWWAGYGGETPEILDTQQIEQDAKLKIYEVEHNSTRAVKRAAGVNTDPVPANQHQAEQQEESQDSGVIEEGRRQGRMASVSAGGIWEGTKRTISEFFSWMMEPFK